MCKATLFFFLMNTVMTIPTTLPAQEITGEYRLKNHHEMVAAFNFQPDSSFEFYFIYGAVDRLATGKYHIRNNMISFSSDKIPGKDFTIRKQSRKGNGSTIKITESSQGLQSNVLCIFMKGEERDSVYSDNNGVAFSPLTNCDSIIAMHMLFPDEFSIIKTDAGNPNDFFELSLNPSLAELSFKNFLLTVNGTTLSGSLPYLFESEMSVFEKK